MKKLRIGVIGTANTHAFQYVGLLNGWREEVPFPQRLSDGRPSGVMHQCFATHLLEASRVYPQSVLFDDARVVRLWSETPEAAEVLERACGVEVVEEPKDAAVGVDAVMVLTEDPNVHLVHAEAALRAGLPTYIDKPLAGSDDQARSIAALADESGASWYSCSSLRWAPGLDEICESVEANYGGAQGVYLQFPARASEYAIHTVEVMGKIMKSFAVDGIHGLSTASKDVAIVEFTDGRSATLENDGAVGRMSYAALIQSRLRAHTWVETDFGLMNSRFLRAFLDFAKTGRAPVTPEEALQALALTHRIQAALNYGS